MPLVLPVITMLFIPGIAEIFVGSESLPFKVKKWLTRRESFSLAKLAASVAHSVLHLDHSELLDDVSALGLLHLDPDQGTFRIPFGLIDDLHDAFG